VFLAAESALTHHLTGIGIGIGIGIGTGAVDESAAS
jgi:hypothetical protein